MKRVVVVGAGIAGLTAAYRLGVLAQAPGAAFEVVLLEASDRPGGVISSWRREGFLLEGGPDAFLTAKPAALALAEELKIQDWLVGTDPTRRRSYVLRAGSLVPVPEGFYLMAPASLKALWRTSLFSWPGKLRMSLEPFLPARRDGADESLASFVRRRLGREALARFAQPMIGGIYTADPEMLSLKATFPQFLEMERVHGSLVRGLAKTLPKGTSGPRYGLFATFRDGMQSLVDILAARLPDGCLRLKAPIQALVPPSAGNPWRLMAGEGKVLEADAVCLALPAWASSRLLAPVAKELADHLAAIPYADCATLNIAFRRDQVDHPLDGMGFVVPAVEERDVLSCSFSSVKFPGRAPEGSVLLRAFAGGALQADRLAWDDARLTRAVLDDLAGILGIRGEPLFVEVRRHVRSMAQYHVGHLDRLGRIAGLQAHLPGLFLIGNAFRGAGIPDNIALAEEAAAEIARRLEV